MTAERRVHPPRRNDDLEMEVATWIAPFIKHKSLLIALGAMIGSGLTLVGGAYAMRYTDPTKQTRAVAVSLDSVRFKVDSVIVPRLVNVETAVSEGRADRVQINKKLDWDNYMICRIFMDRYPNEYPPDICANGRPK